MLEVSHLAPRLDACAQYQYPDDGTLQVRWPRRQLQWIDGDGDGAIYHDHDFNAERRRNVQRQQTHPVNA